MCVTFLTGVFVVLIVTYLYFRSFFKYHLSQRLFAWFVNKSCRDLRDKAEVKSRKTELFKHILDYKKKAGRSLKILDVGAGSEENIDFLPVDSKLVALEPIRHFKGYFEKNVEKSGIEAEFVVGVAQDMPFKDEEFDIVITTFVMCSVVEIEKAMREIKRVLKPGGLYLFLEHVRADKSTWTWYFQFPAEPILWFVGDGCSCRKLTAIFIKAAGFSDVNVDSFDLMPLPLPCRPCIVGYAKK